MGMYVCAYVCMYVCMHVYVYVLVFFSAPLEMQESTGIYTIGNAILQGAVHSDTAAVQTFVLADLV